MRVKKQLIFALIVLCGMTNVIHAQGAPSESRGGLLYSTHCSACHASTIHWREQRLVTDWNSLKAQIDLWQFYIGLDWLEEDIVDVALYLNAHYYNFVSAEPKALSRVKDVRLDSSQ